MKKIKVVPKRCLDDKDIKKLEDGLIEFLKKSNENLEDNLLEELINHSKNVERISLEIYDEIFDNDDYKKVIIAGALLHDIRRYDYDGHKIKDKSKGESHNIVGSKYIYDNDTKEVLINFSNLEIECIISIIKYHKGKVKKYTGENNKNIKIIEIVRAADKISKVYKKHYDDPILNFFREIIICEKLQKLKSKKVKKVAKNLLEELA